MSSLSNENSGNRARKRQPSIQNNSNRWRGICQSRWPLHRGDQASAFTPTFSEAIPTPNPDHKKLWAGMTLA
jgi:hypothetical protein